MKTLIRLNVNGRARDVATEPTRTLLEILREDLSLTGTKQGCGEGECGTCTVLLDGAPINACLMLGVEAAGHEVTTIEGLADGMKLHPLQQAFIEHGAIQCGFCTPGMILAAKALLDRCPDPTEDDIRGALGGNLCRCTGYQKIVEAVLAAARGVAGSQGGAR
ncbi:MAG: (2Fe-2S)-binding protein [Deltaproteobacteria bacterium]|nr:(2Fe-2S)-binding protein [Deltaproteobacteria bacterium]